MSSKLQALQAYLDRNNIPYKTIGQSGVQISDAESVMKSHHANLLALGEGAQWSGGCNPTAPNQAVSLFIDFNDQSNQN